MVVEDVVIILVDYCQQGKEEFADSYGPEARSAVEDLLTLVEEELQDQLDFDSLWQNFVDDPQGLSGELAGTLEAVIEADPGLAEEMARLLGEVQSVDGRWEEELQPGKIPPGEVPPGVPAEEPVSRPEREPLAPSRDFKEKGTYLYANRPHGGITVSAVLGQGARALQKEYSAEVQLLFEQLRTTLDERFDLEPGEREHLSRTLNRLQVEFEKGPEAEEERIVRALRTIRRVEPRLLDELLDWLEQFRGEAGPSEELRIES